jgi:hypothetical protein
VLIVYARDSGLELRVAARASNIVTRIAAVKATTHSLELENRRSNRIRFPSRMVPRVKTSRLEHVRGCFLEDFRQPTICETGCPKSIFGAGEECHKSSGAYDLSLVKC